ncbi:hypothetical protein HYH03_013374 [Edaphochlamys debaryana]|uniref:Uncharacterized protein n=1 Tax=Edaphochlamys debaryana TaxID=47281 RepID=A0A835XQ83_9CHLO|nr:hypothetical protein HYH03_013374 [Edaphochlamys debaryana]|eukprot:KAG2488071.1 hypothetical protein HYH03_013374 [Edaphochlamys debaryana]
MPRAKVLVVPVFQKTWLYHVWAESTPAEAAAAERGAAHWTQGSTLQEKASLLGKEIGANFKAATQKQWKAIQAADEGTFRHRLHQLAQWVLSQEDPTETFLKSLPKQPSALEIIHPSSLKERLVRRRLRRLALAQEHFHNRRILGWALATLPQLPLVLTPFPNVTLYYTAYKMVSHYQAVQGCRTLRAVFERYDAQERERAAQGNGGGNVLGRVLRPLRWWGSDDRPGLGHGAGGKTNCRGAAHSAEGGGVPVPSFRSSRALDQAVRPLDRWESPISDGAAERVIELFAPRGKDGRGGKDRPPSTDKKGGDAKGKGTGKGKGKDGGKDGEDQDGGDEFGGLGALPELVTRARRRAVEAAIKKQEQEGSGSGR